MPPPRSICLSTCPARPLAISNGGSSPYSPPPPPPPPHPPPPPPPPAPPFMSLKQIFHSTCSSSDPLLSLRPYPILKQTFHFTCSSFTEFQKFFWINIYSIVYTCKKRIPSVDVSDSDDDRNGLLICALVDLLGNRAGLQGLFED